MYLKEAISVIPRSLISLILLFLVCKLIGKKQVSELSLFDYVIGISIGNFTAEMIMDFQGNFTNGVVAIIVFGLCSYIVSMTTLKSMTLRRILIGTPTIIVQNGKIIKENLVKTKIDINDLLEQVRTNGYFDLSELEYVIMEANGKLSILSKSENKPTTLKDMNIKTDKTSLCANIIIDGKIMNNNLFNMKKDENWLLKELKIKGINLDEILLATLDNNEKLVIYKDEGIIENNVLE